MIIDPPGIPGVKKSIDRAGECDRNAESTSGKDADLHGKCDGDRSHLELVAGFLRGNKQPRHRYIELVTRI